MGQFSMEIFCATGSVLGGNQHAGRTFAAYGGIYVVASLIWLWAVENRLPDRWDIIGAAACLAGTAIILFAPRG